jgi:hypothetical protein
MTKTTHTHSPTKIAPSLKAFMNKALPKDEGKHVLALGEDHTQTTHVKWLQAHLDELKSQHNLGAIGIELPPFMEVFLWAYKDGKLPVGNDPEKAKAYVERAFKAFCESDFEENTKAKVGFAIAALDKNIPVTLFDNRNTLRGTEILSPSVETLRSSLADNEDTRQAMRHNNGNIFDDMSALSPQAAALTTAFILLEAQKILSENPKYQAQLDNIEAVITARRNSKQGGGQRPGHDATSAAIMQASIPTAKNAITISGLNHLIGYVSNQYQNDGTFNSHLDALGLKTSTALVADTSKLLPSTMAYDSKKTYKEVKASQAALQRAHMQEPLQNLADNKPWADMIAAQVEDARGKKHEH